MRVIKVGLLTFGLALGSFAIAAENPNPDITRQELQNFDNFLDAHPAVKADLVENPRAFMKREKEFEKKEKKEAQTREERREERQEAKQQAKATTPSPRANR